MPLKKYVNGSWVDSSYRRYETGTDTVTNLPVEILTDGQPVTSWTMKGNTTTSGTPSPQNPVTINGTGNKTANLTLVTQENTIYSSNYNNYTVSNNTVNVTTGAALFGFIVPVLPNTEYTCSAVVNNTRTQMRIREFSGLPIEFTGNNFIQQPVNQNFGETNYATFTTTNETTYILFVFYVSASWVPVEITNIMLNTGSTPLPYEPYGKYKISILKDLQPLTPIYLNEPLMKLDTTSDTVNSSGEVTRIIARYEITGTEQWRDTDTPIENTYCYRFTPTGIINVGQTIAIDSVCTHFQCGSYYNSNKIGYQHSTDRLYFRVTQSTVESFKQWLADLYAAGTPVTVWYILATPTTETVTAPTITTTGGTVTLDVDTTVKPSELDLTYHGWHEHQPLKRENGAWV